MIGFNLDNNVIYINYEVFKLSDDLLIGYLKNRFYQHHELKHVMFDLVLKIKEYRNKLK